MDLERSWCFSFEISELETYSRCMKSSSGVNGCYTTHYAFSHNRKLLGSKRMLIYGHTSHQLNTRVEPLFEVVMDIVGFCLVTSQNSYPFDMWKYRPLQQNCTTINGPASCGTPNPHLDSPRRSFSHANARLIPYILSRGAT